MCFITTQQDLLQVLKVGKIKMIQQMKWTLKAHMVLFSHKGKDALTVYNMG